jgi:hypothetical protein
VLPDALGTSAAIFLDHRRWPCVVGRISRAK